MTLMVTEKCSWSQEKASNELCGDLSLILMGKTHAMEAVGESQGFDGLDPDDSSVRKRRCISLNAEKSDCLVVPMHVISMSKMSAFERKNLELRFRRELELVQSFQKKNGVFVSSSGGGIESMKQGPSRISITVLMKQCETLLKRLTSHQHAWIFNTPVDVVKLNIPDYFTVIKQPMDLGTVKFKLASGAYSSPQDFASDVRLTFSNAVTYNPPTNDVHVMANIMRKFFEMRWKPIDKKVAAADKAALKIERKDVKSTSEFLKKKIPLVDHVTVVLDSEPKMTDEEKLNLSRRLSLIQELPQHIVDFLKRNTDNVDQCSEDEIEIDFDSISIEALLKLKELLDEYAQGNNLDQLKKTGTCEMEVAFIC